MAIDVRSLRYFVAMVTTGSISRAATELHIAQPALSLHLKRMEAELGVKLLERSSRGVVATSAGQRFLAHSRDVLEKLRFACEDVREGASEPVGSIAIGMPQSIGMALTPRLVRDVIRQWPRLHLQIVETSTGHVPSQLVGRTIDLGMTFLRDKSSGLRYRGLVEEELVLIGPPPTGHRKTGTFESRNVRFTDLADIPLMLPSPQNSLRQVIERYAQQAQVRLNVLADVDSIPQLIAIAGDGLGHTILSYPSVVDAITEQRVSATRLVQPKPVRTVYLCRLENIPATSAMTAMESLILSTTQELVDEGEWPGRLVSPLRQRTSTKAVDAR